MQNSDATYRRGKDAFMRHDFEEANRFLTQALEQNPEYADLYSMIGVIYNDKGRFSEAIKCFSKALEINPDYTEAKINLMILLQDIGRFDKAGNILRHIQSCGDSFSASLDPMAKSKLANLHAVTGDMYLMLELHELAIHEYEEALSHRAGFADIRLKLAKAYKDAGQFEISEVQCRACLKARPDYIDARIFLGAVLMAQGRRTQAIDAWKQVFALDPENEEAIRYLHMAGEDLEISA